MALSHVYFNFFSRHVHFVLLSKDWTFLPKKKKTENIDLAYFCDQRMHKPQPLLFQLLKGLIQLGWHPVLTLGRWAFIMPHLGVFSFRMVQVALKLCRFRGLLWWKDCLFLKTYRYQNTSLPTSCVVMLVLNREFFLQEPHKAAYEYLFELIASLKLMLITRVSLDMFKSTYKEK